MCKNLLIDRFVARRKKLGAEITYLLTMAVFINSSQMICGQIGNEEFEVDSAQTMVRSKKYRPHISGFIQAHYLHPFNTNGDSIQEPDRFRVLRARVRVDGKISKRVSYVIEMDPRAPDITGIMRDAYISLGLIPDQTIRIGQQKTQFGYENRESSSRLYFVNRTEVSDNLSRGYNLRDIGIGILGKITLNKQYRLEDAITLVNGAGMNVVGPEDFNRRKNLWGRIGIRSKSESLMWRAGVSGGFGDQKDLGDDPVDPADDFVNDFKRFGADVEVDQKWFFFASEFVFGKETINDTLSDSFGYYAALAGKTPWKAGPLVRYDVLDDEWKRLTIGAYYGLPDDRLRVLLNYEFRGYHSEETAFGEDDRLYIQLQVRF
jgi:hypothetical protein